MSWYKKTPSTPKRAKLHPQTTSPATEKFFDQAKKTAPAQNQPKNKSKLP